MDLSFRKCTLNDVQVLLDFSKNTFIDTFAHLNTKENMKAYLDDAFSQERLLKEISRGALFNFLYADGKLAGYIKLNEAPNQTDINDLSSLEVERIYVSKEFQGKGLGRALMDKVVETAILSGKSYIWLGVWELNEKAISFYNKCGFYQSGTHSFIMGDEVQRDFIMRKDL